MSALFAAPVGRIVPRRNYISGSPVFRSKFDLKKNWRVIIFSLEVLVITEVDRNPAVTNGESIMECDKNKCSFAGQCYPEGAEVCGEEIGFANCWVCKGGELDYRPRLISPNYPVLAG